MTALLQRTLLQRLPRWLLPTLFTIAVLAVPFVFSGRIVQLTILLGVNALLGQSINLLTGYTGQISLGQAAMYGAGAYGSGVLSTLLEWPIWVTVPAGIALAMLLGALVSIPAGRVRDFYLAMVSLGLGILGAEVIAQWDTVTGGFSGLSNVPSSVLRNLTVFGHTFGLVDYYYLAVLAVAVVTWLFAGVLKSHIGRSFVAISESEVAAATLGVSAGSRKRMAYVLSAGLAGVAGTMYAHLVGFLSPDAFSVDASVAILVFAVLGGLRTLAGPFLGAAVLTYLPDQLQAFSRHQLLIYGVVLLVSFLILPRGLTGLLPYRTGLIHRSIAQRGPDEPNEPASVAVEEPADGPLLEVAGLSKAFVGVRALDGVDMSVRTGSIHGLIGPNGSGKTTLLNVISGVEPPTAGTVRFAGARIDGRRPHEVARLGVARTFQHPLCFPELTVRENALVGAERLYRGGLAGPMLRLPGAMAEERRLLRDADQALERVGLTELADELAGGLPFGRQRMLELARALVARPRLLMLDEPAAGLAEPDLVELGALLRDLRDGGMTIVVIEHHVDFLFELASSVTVLDHGAVIFSGATEDVRRDPRVLEAYLGSETVKEDV
ncbi:ATP-binding cassette domain-containing protein [Pseudonocardia acaciae]|uniref:branched-chain amino acid ABC transporter ATP-binding protein/permease n=1 Tax=Pseudonocardia acaciae TaxID=551276 RepID=UPI000560F998|nr:branched-chain amino acid ABC transporter ATP-binding protein/permease [Pseudonocardia acaciae]